MKAYKILKKIKLFYKNKILNINIKIKRNKKNLDRKR